MNTGRVVLATVLVGVIGVASAILGQQWLGDGKPLSLPVKLDRPDDGRLDSLPDFRLPDRSGREVHSGAWAGKVVVLNYWATWCPPCLREIPLFSEAQERYADAGLQVVGIAIDRAEDVESFLDEHPVRYPVLIGGTEAIEISRRLGNRMQGLPFTVIFDRDGKKVHAQVGEVTEASLARQLAALIPAAAETQTVSK
jgi:thiol-disulfide isomerase/thioredoxin